MSLSKHVFLTTLLFLFLKSINAQQSIQIDVPLNQAKPNKVILGYYNTHLNNFIVEQEDKNNIARVLYDTDFNLIKKYTVNNDSIALGYSTTRFSFFTQFCTTLFMYELYVKEKFLKIIQLDFFGGNDKNAAILKLQEQYSDEIFLTSFTNNNYITILTFTKKGNKILLYKFIESSKQFESITFSLPQKTLTKQEIKERGKSIAVKYGRDLNNLQVNNLREHKKLNINIGNQLFYDENNIFIALKSPENVGFHLVELHLNDSSTSYINLNVNKIVLDNNNAAFETIPTIAAIDSILILQNTNKNLLEYFFYNIYNKNIVAHYAVSPKKNFNYLVHSPLKQLGTFLSADDDKEIDKEKLFLKRKNKGVSFLQVSKNDEDSIVISFGSFTPTAGIAGTLLGLSTFAAIYSLNITIENYQILGYITSIRNKFLHAHSKFSTSLQYASSNSNVNTVLDKLVDDRNLKNLESQNSFIIDTEKNVFIGILDKKSSKIKIEVY